tara:strand:- start:1035 stop:2108 length:1074 start_codon:yes stop_codon:yes gene_type:complete
VVILKALIFIILLEILFRIFYYLKYKKKYFVSLKFKWKNSHITTHPFLSFSYKKNSVIDKNQKLPYPLHHNKFYSYKNPLNINNFGHFGDDFVSKKDKIRVMCLGASTTANNISDGEKDYNYPKLLEEYLNKNSDKDFEVLNCGIGGWTSVDILINFVLNLVKLSPDYIILYHGHNDLHLHLMDNFQSDYQHGRRNLGEVIHKIKRAYLLPKIKFWHSYEFIKDKLFGTGNIRNDVLRLITKNKIDYTHQYFDLKQQSDIFEYLIVLCNHFNINVILSSFCYYNWSDSFESNKIQSGVDIENNLMEELSTKFNCSFVDQDKLISKDKEHFVDSMHFTPSGMGELVKNFSKIILSKNK